MPRPFRLAGPYLLLLILLLIAPAHPTPVLADYDPITGLDTHDKQLLEKRRELQRKQDQLLSKTDQLYNEVNTEPVPGFFEENVWNLLALGCVSLVILRLVIRPRRSRVKSTPVMVITHPLLPTTRAQSEQSIIGIDQEPASSHAPSFLAMMGMTSQRRHRSRSRSHRHRRRSH